MTVQSNGAIKFCGLMFKGLSRSVLFTPRSGLTHVVTVNAALIKLAHQYVEFREVINNNFSTFDGQVPFFLARLMHKNVYFEKISGSDLAYDLCSYAYKENLKVFLLGGEEDSNTSAVTALHDSYRITVAGYSPPHRPYPFDQLHNQAILGRIEAFSPDILLVGFGAPKQEYWIRDNGVLLEKLGIMMAVGCGGTFDFLSGKVPRAPLRIQRAGLEGLYRFLQEPKLFRLRRLLASLSIFWYIIR
jgi:N-acetylglucosaminyldiphosphoundecaprenol N-acetyl-beta-D-mannosaminyltransferase